jgi:hypothetical protein
VPGAYYSDPGAAIFMRLEEAVENTHLSVAALRELSGELERVLPSPLETAVDATFGVTMTRLGLGSDFDVKAVGKRVALRMLATITGTLSQPAVRESGVMRLPQTIPGLFDSVPKKRPAGPTSGAPALDGDNENDRR